MVPLRVRMDLGAMAVKRYTTFPQTSRLEPYYLVSCRGQSLGAGPYPSEEMQSLYSTALVNWAVLKIPQLLLLQETIRVNSYFRNREKLIFSIKKTEVFGRTPRKHGSSTDITGCNLVIVIADVVVVCLQV